MFPLIVYISGTFLHAQVTSASLLRIGCDLNALPAGDAVETGLTEGQVCEWIKDEENKKVPKQKTNLEGL